MECTSNRSLITKWLPIYLWCKHCFNLTLKKIQWKLSSKELSPLNHDIHRYHQSPNLIHLYFIFQMPLFVQNQSKCFDMFMHHIFVYTYISLPTHHMYIYLYMQWYTCCMWWWTPCYIFCDDLFWVMWFYFLVRYRLCFFCDCASSAIT